MSEINREIDQAYKICLLQAQVDGAFDEALTRHWFEAAWELCATMIDLIPEQQIREPLSVNSCGNYELSHRPNGSVEIFDGYKLIVVLPRPLERSISCAPWLCCLCHPYARYHIGSGISCDGISPGFIQAVARVFTYIVENRGDSELDPGVLSKCGALAFLEVEYVA